MVTEDSTLEFSWPARRPFLPLAEAGFLAFLFLIYVGLSPFALRDEMAFVGVAQGTAHAGDLFRQIAFASVFLMILYAAVRQSGLAAFRAIPAGIAILLLWCIASAAWSVDPGVTLRRAGLAAVIAVSAMLSVPTLGTRTSIRFWCLALALVLATNWVSIPLVHQAVHLSGDPEPQLVGDWRGLYFHKNITGSVCAITAILFFFAAWEGRHLRDAIICIAAITFTVMTRSKSSLVLLPVALAAGAVYRLSWRRALDRSIAIVGSAILLGAALFFVAANPAIFSHLFADPEAFTGRTEIWRAELAFIADHPLLGAGFGSFADAGSLSPLHAYISTNWVERVSHGHNGYLELAVTIGPIGLVLAIGVLLISPLRTFWRLEGARAEAAAPLLALFTFAVLHNLLESDFLQGDGPVWVAFLLLLAVLREWRGAPSIDSQTTEAA